MIDRTAVIIPAAGFGRRMGWVAKAFVELAGEPLLMHALRPFLAEKRVVSIVVALDAETAEDPPPWLCTLDKRIRLVTGGETRGESVANALAAVKNVDIVVIHDAARPLVTPSIIKSAIDAAALGECVIAAIPVTDTIQEIGEDWSIVSTPDRSRLWCAQTPQAFPYDIIVESYQRARQDGFDATDDAAVLSHYGVTVRVIVGSRENIKITVPEDLVIAGALLAHR